MTSASDVTRIRFPVPFELDLLIFRSLFVDNYVKVVDRKFFENLFFHVLYFLGLSSFTLTVFLAFLIFLIFTILPILLIFHNLLFLHPINRILHQTEQLEPKIHLLLYRFLILAKPLPTAHRFQHQPHYLQLKRFHLQLDIVDQDLELLSFADSAQE
jgi:hypothetical protein